jgi:hypothetical protein
MKPRILMGSVQREICARLHWEIGYLAEIVYEEVSSFINRISAKMLFDGSEREAKDSHGVCCVVTHQPISLVSSV